MKGHTTIELTNVKTGQRDKFEDDNMVTNALAYHFANCGLCNTLTEKQDTDLKSILLGGIMLFDQTLEEDPDNIWVPAGVNMIGNGALYEVSNSDVVEFGSYNSSESSFVNNIWTQVYDFTTSQANGTIASVCLTSQRQGCIGAGNSLSNKCRYEYMPFDYYGNLFEIKQPGYIVRMTVADSSLDSIPFSNLDAGSTSHFKNTGEIFIEKYRIPLSVIDIHVISMNSLKLIDTVKISVPESFINAISVSAQWSIDYDGEGNTYLTYWPTTEKWNVNDVINILKINIDNSCEHIQLTNTSGYAIAKMPGHTIIDDGYMIFMKQNSDYSNVIIFNMSNSSAVEITNPLGYIYPSGAWRRHKGRINFGSYVLDMPNHRFIRQNGKQQHTGENTPLIGNPCLSWNTNSGSNTIYIRRHIDYLATINNLEKPIVKTADMTMKVTYTITF